MANKKRKKKPKKLDSNLDIFELFKCSGLEAQLNLSPKLSTGNYMFSNYRLQSGLTLINYLK